MARYIDADKLDTRQRGNNSQRTMWREIKRIVDDAPTADVVPKSEVDRLELTLQGVMWSVDKWLDEVDYDADPVKRAITMREKTLRIIENAKSEVAREIFEEIDAILEYWYSASEDTYEGVIHTYIAELKKKYTGGKT